MRRLLLLLALCMALALTFAQVAVAQDEYDCENFDYQEDAQAVYEEDTSDPSGLDGPIGESSTGEPGVACEELPSRGTGTDTSVEPAAETSVEPSASASAEPGDEVEASPSATTSSSATATASASATGTASASATAEADLPETGGIFPALTLVPLAVLVAGGIFAARLVRR